MTKFRLPLVALTLCVLLAGCIKPRTDVLASQCADLRTDQQRKQFITDATARLNYIAEQDGFFESIILRARDPGVFTHVAALKQCVANLR